MLPFLFIAGYIVGILLCLVIMAYFEQEEAYPFCILWPFLPIVLGAIWIGSKAVRLGETLAVLRLRHLDKRYGR